MEMLQYIGDYTILPMHTELFEKPRCRRISGFLPLSLQLWVCGFGVSGYPPVWACDSGPVVLKH